MSVTRSILFEPKKIKNMELRNRFVRSATYDGLADNGYVTDKQVDLYTNLSKGGLALIITGITYVHESGQISKFQNSIAGDSAKIISCLEEMIHTPLYSFSQFKFGAQ